MTGEYPSPIFTAALEDSKKQMEIAINIEVAFSNPTGMGRYSRELLHHLLQVDTEHSYTFFHSNQYAWPPSGDSWTPPENCRVVALPYSRKRILLSWFLYGGPCTLSKFVGIRHVYHDLVLCYINK